MVTSYIWKDVAYTVSADTLDWMVVSNGSTLVSGVSDRRPDKQEITIYVNRLVEDYLKSEFPRTTGVTVDGTAMLDCTLQDSSGTTLETYRFILGSKGDVVEGIANDPVDGRADPRQKIFVGGYFSTATNVTIQGQ